MGAGRASALVLVAGVLWGVIGVFTKALTAAGLSSVEITAVRMFVGTAGMLAVILLTDRSKLRIQLRHLWMFVGTGIVSLVLFNVCYFTCIQLSEVSIAVILLYTSPLWVTLMSAVLFRERLTGRKLAALAMALVGCALVAGLTGGGLALSPLSLGLGLASGFFYALYSIFGRVALEHYASETVTFYTFLMGAVCLVFLGSPGHIAGVVAADPGAGLWCIGIGLVCTIAPYLLYTKGLKRMETGRAAILATAEPLVGAVLGICAFGETAGPAKLCGMALILVAVVLLNLPARTDADAAEPDASVQ
ncbi:MAG: EamA family transporter [Coriobacteriia bacterium]|nr:EamA family transporter [Coriobacteriia bacterium]